MNHNEEKLRTAKEVVEALFKEALLWVELNPVEWKKYESLRHTLAINKLANASLPDDVKSFIASVPFWGGDPSLEKLRKAYEALISDPETRNLCITAWQSVQEEINGH